ncbi:MAG: maleylpyruvate isomerase family mycothiol-dependent enzyme [Actinobacteria bacterium]|nr:maleylpyruvate isomerase family mycothiol-dependent enzyme [Actinomycetota bacterium]
MSALGYNDWARLHRIANSEFDVRLRQILPEWWGASTPCAEWDIYDLVNHVVTESLWVPVLLAGHHPDSVGGLDGDIIEGDPLDVWEDARSDAMTAVEAASSNAEVFLSTGTTDRQRTVDMAVHSWDLGRALAGDEDLDPELVEGVAGFVWPIATRFAEGSLQFEPSLPAESTDSKWNSVLRILGRDPD